MQKNNYPTWLVPIEIAKKLKEIGFNEPCLVENVETHSEDYNFINFKEEMYSEAIVLLEDVELVSNKDLEDKLDIYKNFVLRTAIPTWEQVLEWFKSKGFHSHIEYTSDNDMFKISIFGILLQTGISYFKTYEEAREELVNKLIEVYKKE